VLPAEVVRGEWDGVLKCLRELPGSLEVFEFVFCCSAFFALLSPQQRLQKQQIQEKYERLLSATPAPVLDCSSLCDPMMALSVIESAVAKHKGKSFI
jgi:hypothetical protein